MTILRPLLHRQMRKESWWERHAKALKRLRQIGIGASVLVLGVGAALMFEYLWLTDGESKSASRALTSIDSLQNFGALSDSDFEAGITQAKTEIDAAYDSVTTIRDSAVADSLFDYWVETKVSRSQKNELEKWKRKVPESSWDYYLRQDPNQLGAFDRHMLRSRLHRFLDSQSLN
jgi:hypothetical protein